MPKLKHTIDEVVPVKKHKQNPIIAHFHGELSNEFARSLDVCMAKNSKNDDSSAVLIAISKTNLYDGVLMNRVPANKKRTLIAIRKKKSNQIKFVEATECSLISYHYNDCSKEETNSSDGKSNISSESARRILFRDFGGKKAMKVLDRKEKMKVNVDIVKDQLDKTLSEFDVGQKITQDDKFDKVKEQQDHVLKELVPKMNEKANKLQDVYSLGDIIGIDILESLQEEAIFVLKTSPDNLPIKCGFLSNIVKSIQRSKIPDASENLLKIKACIYIDALVAYFKQINQVRLNSTVKLQPISQVTLKLDSHFRKKFTQPNINKLTKTNYVIHKATCHIIVLSLLISERFEMDVQNIVEEIGISKTNIFKIINNIAVRPKAKSNIVSIRLPNQLKFFATNYRRRRTM